MGSGFRIHRKFCGSPVGALFLHYSGSDGLQNGLGNSGSSGLGVSSVFQVFKRAYSWFYNIGFTSILGLMGLFMSLFVLMHICIYICIKFA